MPPLDQEFGETSKGGTLQRSSNSLSMDPYYDEIKKRRARNTKLLWELLRIEDHNDAENPHLSERMTSQLRYVNTPMPLNVFLVYTSSSTLTKNGTAVVPSTRVKAFAPQGSEVLSDDE